MHRQIIAILPASTVHQNAKQITKIILYIYIYIYIYFDFVEG
jgi:hypothetical protein